MVLSTPRQLVLIGGGHSHALVLKYWAENPAPGVPLTLISESSSTPYSGMVPGYIAGFYDRQECFINLEKLCQSSGAQFIKDKVTALDLEKQTITITDRSVSFDLASVNIGSSPLVPQSANDTCVIPAKPIGNFLDQWDKIKDVTSPLTIGIVGGGAGGVELAFAMGVKLQNAQIHIFHQGKNLLPGHNQWVQQRGLQKLEKSGIKVHLNSEVMQVKNHVLSTRSGFGLNCDFVFWVTQGIGASWLQRSGLALDDRGFILVNNSLRSVCYSKVFAAGDIATIVNFSRPKAGVFAVRQGLPLFHNLQRTLTGRPLQVYRPNLATLV